MSVIVKGMEMPKNCQECGLYIEGACYAKGYRDYRSIMDKSKPDDCPLIELPPHGDLVDLSDTVHPNDSMRRMTIDEPLRRTCEGWSADRKQYVVIEAEGETDA